MAGAFRIAEAYVEVTADQAAYDASMDRLKSSKNTVKIGVQLDDKGAIAQLARLSQNRAVKVNIDLTGMAALAQLTEKTRDRTTKIKIDLDATSALARLAEVTKDRTVKVKIDLDQTAMARLSSRTYTAQIIAQINDPAYQRVQKLLDKLTADRTVRILASADTRVAADDIRNLTRRQRVRIGVDVDTRVAADDIANLTRRRTLSVVANANTTEARARLDALSRNRTMDIDVRTRGGDLSALSNIGSSSSSSSSGIKSLVGSLTSLTSVIITAAPTVLSLGESLVQMGPAAAVAAPALLSLVSVFAAIKIGTSGIGDAFKAAFAPAATGASAALSAAKAVENAQRSLAKAVQAEKDAEVNAAAARSQAARDVADAQQNLKNTTRDVADANHQAAESVASAERDLTAAQKAARQAQLDLTQARKDAAAELQDLSNQLKDSQLSELQDTFNLADAEKKLAADKAAGAAVSADQLARDQLARDQAAQALAEQQLQTQRLTDQNEAADKAGVEGSATVVQAKQGIADANQTLADKTQALTDTESAAAKTQTDGAQQLAKAQRDLADARAAQVKTATDGARQIADAQDAVAQATDALAQAQESASLKTDKLGQAMARLSPQARSFVDAVLAQRDAWRGLKLDVQDALFQGLGATFTRLSTAVLPSLRVGLTGTASVLNTMAKNAASAVINLAKTGQLKATFASLNEGLKPLSKIPGQFITALAQLSIGAAPAFKRLTTAVANSADSVMKKLSAGLASGGLTDSINRAIDIAKQFGHVLGDAFGILSNLMKAAGTNALGTIGSVLQELRRITAMPEIQTAMKNIFAMINAFAKLFSGAIGTVFSQLVLAFGKIAPSITAMLNSLGNIAPLLGGILLATNPILGVFVLLAPVIGQLIKPIVGIVNALGPLLKTVSSLFGLLAPVLAILLPPIQILITALGSALKPIVAALGPVLQAAARAIGALVTAVAPLLPVIGQMVAALGPVLTPILGIIGMLFSALAPVLAQLGKSLLPPFLKITTTLAGVFKQLQPVLGAALDQLGSKGLVPIVAALGTVIGDLVNAYAQQFVAMFQMLLPIIPVLIPVVVQLAQSLSQILLAVAPLLPQILLLAARMITQLLPAILPVIPVIADLTTALLWLATGAITGVVMPILSSLISFMGGLLGSLQPAITAVVTVTQAISAAFQWLFDVLVGHSIIPDLVNAIIGLFTGLGTKAKQIFNAISQGIATIWRALWGILRSQWNSFWSGLSGAISSARSWMSNAFNGIRTAISGTWSGLWSGVRNTFGSIIGTVESRVSTFSSSVRKVFTSLRDSLGTIWSGIQAKFASPVRYVVNTVYNNGIRKMWDTIASKVGFPQIPQIKLGFNQGGVVPGDGKRDTVPAMLTPGERILSLAQVAQLGGHRAIDAMVGRTEKRGNHYGVGGIVSSITGAVTGAVSSGVDWVKNIAVGGLADVAKAAIKAVVSPLIARIPTGNTDAGRLIKAVPADALNSILGVLGKKDKSATDSGQIAYKGGAGVAQWAPQILQALSLLGQPASWLGTVERRMNQESGGNPTVVNRWDSNWIAGTPSVGLMQVIGPTFKSNAGPFGGTGPKMYGVSTNPLANTYAGLHYAIHRYGSLSALNRPGGYDSGGLLQPGATMAVNRTGRPERVLTADHTAKLDAMLSTGTGGGITIQAVNVNGTFDFSSPADRRRAANELVEEMKEALRNLENSRQRGGRKR